MCYTCRHFYAKKKYSRYKKDTEKNINVYQQKSSNHIGKQERKNGQIIYKTDIKQHVKMVMVLATLLKLIITLLK